MSDYTRLTKCRCCGSGRLHMYLDLGEQPLANSYRRSLLDDPLPVFPLQAMVCKHCWHSQLSIVVNPDLMFKDYLYVSGTGTTIHEYFAFFADFTSDTYFYANSERPTTVLDIAANDASQLNAYRDIGLKTFGVDPAENLAVLHDHPVVVDYWNAVSAKEISQNVPGHTFDLITAQNVFAHVHDVCDFLHNCKTVMHEKSLLFIQTSQAYMIDNGEFDTLYCEHLSFFNTNSMSKLAKRCGMVLENVMHTEIHGGSYVFVLSLQGGKALDSSLVSREIENEKKRGFYTLRTYEQFAENATRCVTNLRTEIANHREEGKTIVGYGAAAKGMTVLNFGQIALDYIVDDNPLKQGRLSPGMNIPIVPSSYLLDNPTVNVFVPLAWNFAKEIEAKIKTLCPNDEIESIRYFPELETVTL